ncbi:hypothetical protein [Winogradskyella pelagia]
MTFYKCSRCGRHHSKIRPIRGCGY